MRVERVFIDEAKFPTSLKSMRSIQEEVHPMTVRETNRQQNAFRFKRIC